MVDLWIMGCGRSALAMGRSPRDSLGVVGSHSGAATSEAQ